MEALCTFYKLIETKMDDMQHTFDSRVVNCFRKC